ncbi:MAG: NADP-dependent oxidoreductase [Synechococcaceae cyanobacterium SM2_3_1]|nr:NADP-dependent oxidoreductase [Synechococcaceae cyanobacterium SM2_3_1]
MQAVVIDGYGDVDVLSLQEVPRPTPAAGEVLIQTRAIGVNPVDWKTRKGRGVAPRIQQLPLILGWDVAGSVIQVGPQVTSCAVGSSVFGMVRFPNPGATYAEFVTAPVEQLALIPEKIDTIQAAAAPLAALTAWQALFSTAHLQKGQTVLIQAAAGGVGHLAVQLAKIHGAHVIATASSRNVEFLRRLGVDEIIDYQVTPFETLGPVADLVLDPLGGEIQARSLKVLKPQGYLVSLVQEPDAGLLARYGVQGSRILVHPDQEQLQAMAHLLARGQLQPHVSTVLPLAEVRTAHTLSEGGHTRGKIVLQISA